MELEQIYLLCIYILFIEFAIVTVVAIGLFVALVVTLRKLDNKKNTSVKIFAGVFFSVRIKYNELNLDSEVQSHENFFSGIDDSTYNLEGPGTAKITYKPEISTKTHGGASSLSGKCANIGGTLTIPANAEVGEYEGSVTVDMIFTGHDEDPWNND